MSMDERTCYECRAFGHHRPCLRCMNTRPAAAAEQAAPVVDREKARREFMTCKSLGRCHQCLELALSLCGPAPEPEPASGGLAEVVRGITEAADRAGMYDSPAPVAEALPDDAELMRILCDLDLSRAMYDGRFGDAVKRLRALLARAGEAGR